MRFLLLAALLTLIAGSAAASAAGPEPTLRVVRAKPLVVAGSGFEAGETVRVVALGHGGKRSKTVVAGARGGFKVELPARRTIGCAPTLVTASGARGGKASLTAVAGCVTVPPPRD